MAATTSSTPISFMDMPAEIRNEIYALALVQDKPIELSYAYERKHFHEPALLSVNKLIRGEAAPLYYGCNIFEAPSPASAYQFLKQLDEQRTSWIRMFRPLDIVLSVSAPVRWFEAMRSNLNRLVAPGKGALKPEAICVPLKNEDGKVVWCRIDDIDDFEVVSGEEGRWSVEWRHGPPAQENFE